ncbi:hypothetical protein [Streptomyces canus]|uniref:hypothetical protein n=1 Tax=Streptomyces canus TaxID=58343 RepID=UPI00382F7A62
MDSPGLHHGSQSKAKVSASQAPGIAQRWLRDRGTTLTAGDPETFPGSASMEIHLREGAERCRSEMDGEHAAEAAW